MAIQHHITADEHVFVGDDRTIIITVYEDDDETIPLNVAAADLVWQLRPTDASSTLLIEKTTAGSPGGISVTGVFNVDPDLNTQRVVIALSAEDSYAVDPSGIRLKKKKYRYSLKRINDGARSTLMFGNFQFLQAPTAAA